MMRARQRRLAEAEWRAAEADRQASLAAADAARLRRALDALPVGVVVADTAGVVGFRNRAAEELAATRPAGPLAGQAVQQLLDAAGAGSAEDRVLELHGPPPRTLVITGRPVQDAGQALGAVIFIEDVTERRQLEAVRRDFMANVSHELRTPIGALSVLAEAISGETDPKMSDRLAGRIIAEAERAGRIIDDLLDLSRIEAGGRQARNEVPAAAVVTSAAERIRPIALQRKVHLDVGELDDATVIGDEDMLVSALANLLDNAVKYSEPGSSVETWAATNGDHVKFVVRDHGIGIPAKDLERIFERFYRVDRARSRDTGGTGLGLAIVRHVVTSHGGEVHVLSREGEGSTFTVQLPVAAGT